MPPKVKFTREEITEKAYEMVRRDGMGGLTARGLACELGTSTAPIFTAFKNIEEVQESVRERAKKAYREYIYDGLKSEKPFKTAGIKYIEFAKDEPKLFNLLFMEKGSFEGVSHYYPGNDESAESVLITVKNRYGMEVEEAKKLYNHLSVYTHGLAVMFAQGLSVFTMDDVSRMLTEVFTALSGKEGAE